MGLDAPNRLPDAIATVLARADRFELFSLDPLDEPASEPGHFWGWRVLGSVVVTSAERDELVPALVRGIAENGGWVAACFDQRHGIRASCGESSVELVVCFECSQVNFYKDGKQFGSVLVTSSLEPVFDRVLASAAVPLAE